MSTRTVHDPFTGKDVQVSNRLTDRLRGKYACGPVMENGEPEFGWRQHEVPPIQIEAAAHIEQLEERMREDRPRRPRTGAGQMSDLIERLFNYDRTTAAYDMIEAAKRIEALEFEVEHERYNVEKTAQEAAKRIKALEAALKEAGEMWIRKDNRIEQLEAALREIADAPAWGAPDRWETTPFEVRQRARDALAQSSPPKAST